MKYAGSKIAPSDQSTRFVEADAEVDTGVADRLMAKLAQTPPAHMSAKLALSEAKVKYEALPKRAPLLLAP